MNDRKWIVIFLKWFSILWTTCAAAIIFVSDIMITKHWPPIMGIPPFNAQNQIYVAFLLAPGAIAALAQLGIQKQSYALKKENTE